MANPSAASAIASPVLLGLDAGGTKTVLVGRCAAARVRRQGPGVNLQRDGLDASAERLAALALEALGALPPAPALRVCAGVAGAGCPDEQAALAHALRQRMASRDAAVEVVPDGLVALEAALPDGASGLVVVVGTGSTLLARTADGEVLHAGGWGPRLGDPGSATSIGRAALGAIADDFDGGEPTVLRARLAEALGVESREDLRRYVNGPAFAPATLAPLVLEAAAVPDWAATRILEGEANALARRAAWLAGRAEAAGAFDGRVSIVGGLTASMSYREVVAEALLRHLPRARIVRPTAQPEEAALARAARLG